MKKVLITLLVLYMASVANALQLSITADPTVPTAYISGLLDQNAQHVLFISLEEIDVVLGHDAPDLSSGPFPLPFTPTPPYVGEIWVLASSTPSVYPIVDGTYLIASGVVGDTIEAWWFDEGSGATGLIGTVELLPEPMTIALLGLGGILLLRRRRR